MMILFSLLRYRMYFLLFELSLYPCIRLFRKWKGAYGEQRKEYLTNMEIAIFFYTIFYLSGITVCVYIYGIDAFRDIAWKAIMAKVILYPVEYMFLWFLSKTNVYHIWTYKILKVSKVIKKCKKGN